MEDLLKMTQNSTPKKITKIFIVKKGDEIPPNGILNFNLKNQISDWYFAKCIFQSGNIRPSIVCYDYNKSKWLSTCAGFKGVEEYYVMDEEDKTAKKDK